MKGRLAIFGAGAHGRSVASVARAAGWTEIVFLDPDWPERRKNAGWPIVGTGNNLGEASDDFDHAHVALGDNGRRLALLEQLLDVGAQCPPIVHPQAWICPDAKLGAGTVVMAQTAINIGSRIGLGVIINTGAVIDHDCELADGVHVSPGASLAGDVKLGQRVWIGVGACARPSVKIGADTIVGAGAAIVSDLPAGIVATGIPARPIVR